MKYISVGASLAASASIAFAQIPVVGGWVDFDAIAVAERCAKAGVASDEVPMNACVEDAKTRAWASHETQTREGYAEALARTSVQAPVVVEDTRKFADSATGVRIPVNGKLVMRSGNTCSWQSYALQPHSVSVGQPEVTTQQGSFNCHADGAS